VSLYLALIFLVEKSINNGPSLSSPLASNFGFKVAALYSLIELEQDLQSLKWFMETKFCFWHGSDKDFELEFFAVEFNSAHPSIKVIRSSPS
jgi:hypothetical protein